MASFYRDLQYAVRTLLKAPAAASVAIIALALGIGVNVSAFITVNGVLLHPMPFAHLERIETIWQSNPKLHVERNAVSAADFLDLEKQNSSFEALAAYRSLVATIRVGRGSEVVRTVQVSPSFFQVLSGKAEQGRVAALDTNAVVVSDTFWKARLGGTPDVIGKRLTLSTGTVSVVGVMPDEFDYPLGTEIWTSLILNPAQSQERSTHDLGLIGLLKPGITAKQAEAEASSISKRLAAAYPSSNGDEAFQIVALQDSIDGTTDRFVMVLLSAAGFVLLLACANIGNLQLARATNRRKEIAVRAALGASRFQIARHLLAESLILSCVAGCLAVILADWNNVYMKQNISVVALRIVPGLRTMTVDPTVLCFAFAASILAGFICSVPAIVHLSKRAAYDNLEESLRERATSSSQHSSGVFRGSLVVSELALALVLLIGAGLMEGTFQRLLNLYQGFDPRNVLIAEVSLPKMSYSDSTRRLAYLDRALTELGRLPGASQSALSARMADPTYLAIEGRPPHRSGEALPGLLATSSAYFEVSRIPILQGRSITAADGAKAARVVVLSKTFARFYFPNSNPIGQRIQLEKGGAWLTVVGVCGDVIEDWFTGTPADLTYISSAQSVPNDVQFLIRTHGNPLALATAVRAKLQSIDETVPLLDVNSLERALADERGGVRAAAQAMSSYAAIALLLAITGIYAVVSFLVSMRTRDIGVHMALGATRGDVLRMMTRQTGKLIVFGVASGLILSIVLARVMAHALFDVVHLETSLWFVLTGVLLTAAFLAAYLPALRATHVDPLTALRHE
jgi:putative ABC transport system permease protein